VTAAAAFSTAVTGCDAATAIDSVTALARAVVAVLAGAVVAVLAGAVVAVSAASGDVDCRVRLRGEDVAAEVAAGLAGAALSPAGSDAAGAPPGPVNEPVPTPPEVAEFVAAGADLAAEEPDELSALPVSARATPGLLAIATPIPNAKARPPTRPTYLAYRPVPGIVPTTAFERRLGPGADVVYVTFRTVNDR